MKKNILSFVGILIATVLVLTKGNAQQTNSPCHLLCNGDFENLNVAPPSAGNGGVIQPAAVNAVPCWRNTAGDCVEIWGIGQTIHAASGNQFAELNCTSSGSLFQDFSATEGTKVTVSFAHRGRAGKGSSGNFFDNQMVVSIKALPSGPTTIKPTYIGLTNTWTPHSFTYICPPGGNGTYRLSFTSLTGTTLDEQGGNFLDSISVDCPVYDPCCPPWNKDELMDMMHYVGSGSTSAPYTLRFVPTTLLNNQMQTYINYLNLIQPPIVRIVINGRLVDPGNNTVGGPVFTFWTAGTSGLPTYSTFPFFTYPMTVGTWYKVRTGIYLEKQNFFPSSCAENDIYVRVKGQELQFSYDGINIINAVPIP